MFNIMNLIPNSENMEPPSPPNFDEKIVSFGKNIGKTFRMFTKKTRAT